MVGMVAMAVADIVINGRYVLANCAEAKRRRPAQTHMKRLEGPNNSRRRSTYCSARHHSRWRADRYVFSARVEPAVTV
jgi:hypothetical protein